VDPDILSAWNWDFLLEWAENRAREDLVHAPAHARITLLAGADANNTAMLDSWKMSGFKECRRFYDMRMEFDGSPQAAVVADGYEIRAMAEGEERKVYDALMAGFADHYGYVEPDSPEAGFDRWKHYVLEAQDFDRNLQLIAVDNTGVIAGAILCRPTYGEDTEMGWINSLAVRPAHRRKGLGKALMHQSFEVLHANGKTRVGVGVDADSITDATRLYTRCGMHQYNVFVEVSKIIRDGTELANLGEKVT